MESPSYNPEWTEVGGSVNHPVVLKISQNVDLKNTLREERNKKGLTEIFIRVNGKTLYCVREKQILLNMGSGMGGAWWPLAQ